MKNGLNICKRRKISAGGRGDVSTVSCANLTLSSLYPGSSKLSAFLLLDFLVFSPYKTNYG